MRTAFLLLNQRFWFCCTYVQKRCVQLFCWFNNVSRQLYVSFIKKH